MNPEDESKTPVFQATQAPGQPPEAARPPVPSRPPSPAPSSSSGSSSGRSRSTAIERVARSYMAQQRSERLWSHFFRLAWLALAVAVAWGLMAHRLAPSVATTPHTALVEVRGEISAGSEAGAEALVAALKNAFEDNAAQAVVLRINSPGGSPVQSGIINDEIKRLKLKHKKKVYAVVEEVCASGAYYIAVAADEIYVDKASIVGSIGVLMDGFGFVGLMEKLGIERRLLTAGTNKGMLDPFTPQNEKQTAYAKAMIDQIHKQFINVVREGRGERLKETPETFSGLFWNGEEAIRLGLADKVGSLEFVAREVIKAEEIVDYTPHDNVAERLAKRFGAAVGGGAVKALREIAPLR